MKKVFVLLNDTFEEIEALTVVDYLRRADIDVKLVSMNENLYVKGGHDIEVKADILFNEVKKEEIDILYIPGGLPAAKILSENKEVLEIVKFLDEKDKIVASICAGPLVLNNSKIAVNDKITSYPSIKAELKNIKEYSEDVIVKSNNIITSRGPATAVYMALTLIEEICGVEKRKEIDDDILFDYIRK